LTGYDGVFEIPGEVLHMLKDLGFDIAYITKTLAD